MCKHDYELIDKTEFLSMLEQIKKDGVHQMKVIDQRDSDTEGKSFPFSILGVKGIHKHPRTGKIETAGLYSREAPNDQAIPLKHEAEKLLSLIHI